MVDALASSDPRESILITGATGFVGGNLLHTMLTEGFRPRVLGRRAVPGVSSFVHDMQRFSPTDPGLQGVDTLVHCAGFAHAFETPEATQQAMHDRVNRQLTLDLAEAAVQAGLRRFVFCSSIKATGDPGSLCADESFDAAPDTAYGIAKRAAEEGLLALSARTGLELVILRLSMVYGPGSRGNMERMFQLVRRGRFPPLPDTGNRRSAVFVDDVVTALLLACRRPEANGVYVVAHPEPWSGRDLYLAMCHAAGREPAPWAVPEAALRGLGWLGDQIGRHLKQRFPFDSQVVGRLLDSAEYSPRRLCDELGWSPRFNLGLGLRAVAAGFAEP